MGEKQVARTANTRTPLLFFSSGSFLFPPSIVMFPKSSLQGNTFKRLNARRHAILLCLLYRLKTKEDNGKQRTYKARRLNGRRQYDITKVKSMMRYWSTVASISLTSGYQLGIE
ncbi:hypothetical protein E2C01_045443 [Portunus trituberculatus]|uniref:Uncharacterized protein n=1 Tax=Portunus trituberculatus TaxID=210409 RepID=A0A5B7G531_PORTR|nr:hypothetical protein [Portunus trituberculatus]